MNSAIYSKITCFLCCFSTFVQERIVKNIMQSGNNEEYIDLIFERIEDASILSNFYCGIPDMDDFIHEKLQGYLNRTECDLL